MLTLDSKTKQFVSACTKLGCCQEAIDWMALTKDEDSIKILLERYSNDPKANKFWSQWIIKFLGTLVDRDIRITFINAIKDTMLAFETYLECDNLTDEEDSILEIKFKDKLPTAEKELQDGKIKRKKGSLAHECN